MLFIVICALIVGNVSTPFFSCILLILDSILFHFRYFVIFLTFYFSVLNFIFYSVLVIAICDMHIDLACNGWLFFGSSCFFKEIHSDLCIHILRSHTAFTYCVQTSISIFLFTVSELLMLIYSAEVCVFNFFLVPASYLITSFTFCLW